MIGTLSTGGNSPVRIKAMIKTPVQYLDKLINEALTLQKEGAEAIRIAVREEKDAKLARILKNHITIPLVADIHFHYKNALKSIEQGFDAIRLNPANITKRTEIKQVVKEAKNKGISMRIGVNSGGFKKKFKTSQDMAEQMVNLTADYIKFIEDQGFFDLMVSLKGSDVLTTIAANKLFARSYDYPLHLGVTATGPFLEGVTKSSVGLGCLLSQGIGGLIRVSLTADSFQEVRVAKYILSSLNLRSFGFELISCPTCSRCEVNLIDIVEVFKKRLTDRGFNKPLKIAIMGCVVNGPGEAYQADVGVAFGKKKAVIFQGDKIIKKSNENNVVDDLIREVERIWS